MAILGALGPYCEKIDGETLDHTPPNEAEFAKARGCVRYAVREGLLHETCPRRACSGEGRMLFANPGQKFSEPRRQMRQPTTTRRAMSRRAVTRAQK